MARVKVYKTEERVPGLPSWKGMIGFGAVLDKLRSLTASGALPQVIMFDGRDGLGKRALAAAVVALHFCRDGSACGECDGCKRVLAGSHPDALWSDSADAAHFKIEDARLLQEFLALNPGVGSGARIAVVTDVDRMNVQAANRLLKILEEPPPYGRVIFTTSRLDLLPDTVASRCLRWRIQPPGPEEAKKFLVEQMSLHGKALPGDVDTDEILRCCGYAPGRLVTWCSSLADDNSAIDDLCSRIVTAGDAMEALRVAEEFSRKRGFGLQDLVTHMEIQLNRMYRHTLCEDAGRGQGANPTRLSPDSRNFNPASSIRRRTVLAGIRKWALAGKVSLNVQLNAEAVAMAGVQESR